MGLLGHADYPEHMPLFPCYEPRTNAESVQYQIARCCLQATAECFQTSDIPVLLLTKKGGEGLTLSAADRVIIMVRRMWPNNTMRSQCSSMCTLSECKSTCMHKNVHTMQKRLLIADG